MRRRKSMRVSERAADANHRVVSTVVAGPDVYRRKPCDECPWRRDSMVGAFPAQAYRLSANCAVDKSDTAFGCHMAGVDESVTCAGFLLSGSDDNLAMRLRRICGDIDMSQVSDGGVALYQNYFEMAVANGVAPDDPALRGCRRRC